MNGLRLSDSNALKASTMKRISTPTLMKTISVLVRARSADADDQQRGDGEHEERGRQVDRPALARRLGDRVGQREAEGRVEELAEVAAPADGHGRDGDAVLEDQVPADDPGDELAHRRVGVRVRAARDRDRGGHLRVGEGGEGAGHAGEDEGQDDRRARAADRLAEDDEDPGADDGAEPQRREVEQAHHPLERLPALLCLGDQRVGGLRGEEPRTVRDGHAPIVTNGTRHKRDLTERRPSGSGRGSVRAVL